ncbi:DUF4173 domain-containing protein [Pedobacter fastidiosus]|uniref:DUF4173 domain-containing protein n=1 Tax=Pedobacter fastidiosus TaxID=2765361 RepID=A0ABR7KPK3_9SPHI|nr:DUF4173 domain-containing protein [Pedobacter fastidiosus]MBC6110021.1 DUF4173 domain-containing protein [Pedobacter fastidiosus]
MKNKSNFLLLSTLLGGLLFNFLFWKERLALNLLIYSVYLLIITFTNPEVIKSKKLKIYALAHQLAGILVVINNSDLTLVTYYISLLLFIGIAHNQQIRTVFTAMLAGFLQMVTVPFNAIKNLADVRIGNFNLKPFFKLLKYILIPLVIVTVFTCLYSAASNVFAHYVELALNSIADSLGDIINFLFKDLDLPQVAFFCFGLILTSGILLSFFDKSMQNAEFKCKEQLSRIRRHLNQKSAWFEFIQIFTGGLLHKKLALKTEYIIGLISFGSLNLLLLSLNAIDITTLWFGYKPSGNFSSELHQGTNSLIFSIVMAMAVIIYFFRGNLNFYSKSKTLRFLAFAWMIQNCILIISVFIRDGYYIEFHGLTHKRIGVLVFAILCIIGLATVYVKVAKQKTLFYLFKTNGNIWFALLLVFSTVNWDVLIVKYNLNHTDSVSIDPDYLISLSEKTLPLLDKNRNKISKSAGNESETRLAIYANPKDVLINKLDQRIGFFKERYEKVSWLSWNLQDWNTAEYFGLNK